MSRRLLPFVSLCLGILPLNLALSLAPTLALALAPALARPVFLDPLGPTDCRQSYIDANVSCCWLDCTSGIVLIGVETMEQSKRSSMGTLRCC